MSHIILIGFMGCGKSTVGIRLSYRLRRVVEDTDKLIERKTSMSIKELFASKGEEYFRQMETECLKDIMISVEDRIIATGGGLPLREENQVLLKQLGLIVYLRISPDKVWERLKNDTQRPILQCDNPYTEITDLMKQRDPVYSKVADIIIDVDDKNMEQILNELINKAVECGFLQGGVSDEVIGD